MLHTKGWGAYCHRNERLQKGATMNCEMCGSPIKKVPAGIGRKTGKPYDAFKVCSNIECGFKPQDENGTRNVVVNSLSAKPNANGNGDNKADTMLFSYAKDIVVAEIAQRTSFPEDPFDRAINGFKKFKKAL